MGPADPVLAAATSSGIPIRLMQGRDECSCFVHVEGVSWAHRLESVGGCAMRGMLEFQERYGLEAGRIEALVRRERGPYRNRNRK